MKTSVIALSALSLGSLVAAAPLKVKREDVVWVTDVVVVTTVVEMTTTVWVDELPKATPTSSAAGLFFESQGQQQPAAPTTTAVPSTSTSTTSTKPTTSSTPAAAPVVPVVQPTQPAQSPPSQASPPAQTSSAAAAPSTPAGGSSGGSSGPASGSFYTGDLTFYDPNGGYGSCGTILNNNDDVVAIPVGMMNAVSTKSNGHPMCGKKVAVVFNGQTYYATASDKCEGCKDGDLDLTSGFFKKVTNGAVDGRGVGLAKWYFVE